MVIRKTNWLYGTPMYKMRLKAPNHNLFHEDQKVYKCRHTLVSLGLRVDYTADRFNSLALTDITADTLIALRRERFIYLQEHYCVGIRRLFTLQTHWWRLGDDVFKL